ncbi:MAG: hypothetical protein HQL10_10895 [Nitrospirae bacterium]|nr:hypothetical protein [Nitrospirota bacterium]
MTNIFALISLVVAAIVPILVIVFANTYSESPFGYAPQMYLVMTLGLAWSILNLALSLKERFRGIKGRLFLLNAFVSVSPIIYFIVWNMFFRKY